MSRIIAIFTLTALMAWPGILQAVTLTFSQESKDLSVGDVFIVDVLVQSPDELINVVDGIFQFDPTALHVEELSTGGSILKLWTELPSYYNDEGRVQFIGGTPDGFQDEEGLLFKAIFSAKKEGQTQLAYTDDTAVFLHDGSGTKAVSELNQLQLTIGDASAQNAPKNDWNTIISQDTTPPKDFEITLGKDSSVYDNQYFISFFTTDDESGVAYYEVKEGKSDYVRATSPFVLIDQTLQGVIAVKAVDNAGNERIVEFDPSGSASEKTVSTTPLFQETWFLIVLSMFGLAIIIIFITSVAKRKKSDHEQT